MSLSPANRERFLGLLKASATDDSLLKLTLGKYRGEDAELKNLFVRPVVLKAGPQLSFVFRYATRDITKNFVVAEALTQLDTVIGRDFLDAHLFTRTQTVQLACDQAGDARLHIKTLAASVEPPSPVGGAEASPQSAPSAHDRPRHYLVSAEAPWLRALGVTDDKGRPREAMAGKFRQINRFVELISHLVGETRLPKDRPFRVADMGCGKGYLTFAVAAFFGERVSAVGVELRPELASASNQVAREQGFKNLSFIAGTIAEKAIGEPDVLIALHACDTATDDALAAGIAANAALIVVSPCCHKELRSQLAAPAVLASALSHGIFQERQSEFVTDALRAQLLEWAGYRTKVFEFVSTEHTAKNLMIAAIREKPRGDPVVLSRIRELARFYGIRHQHLATRLALSLRESDGL